MTKPAKPNDSIADMDAKVGTFSVLEAISVVEIGAFMDWGFSKDLFVPGNEQKEKIAQGELCIVYIYRDAKTGRIAASTKLDKYLDKRPVNFKENDKVKALIANSTDLGYKAIINHTHWGLLYKEEVFQPLHYGQTVEAFVKKIRPDGKIDLCLQNSEHQSMDDLFKKIMDHLKASKGSSTLTDKTPVHTIYALFGVSKKKFKMAIGMLYKKKLITISDQGIKLVNHA